MGSPRVVLACLFVQRCHGCVCVRVCVALCVRAHRMPGNRIHSGLRPRAAWQLAHPEFGVRRVRFE
eukprot:10689351-Alexandrium_andersonii.AAC.1